MGLPAGTYQIASVSYLDAGGEIGHTTNLYGKVITAANEVAQAAAWATVLTKMDALALGARKSDRYNDKTTYAVSRPTNGAAREVALEGIFRDTVNGQVWRGIIVPTLDISLITYVDNVGAKDAVDPSTTEVSELIAALEAFPLVNPYAQANTVVVDGVVVVRGQK